MSDFSSNWTDLTRALDTMQRHYAQAGAQARLDVERRVQRWSHQASATLGRIADAGADLGGVRNALAVKQALDASRPRFAELLRQQFAGLKGLEHRR